MRPVRIKFNALDATRYVTIHMGVNVRNRWRIRLGALCARLAANLLWCDIEVKNGGGRSAVGPEPE